MEASVFRRSLPTSMMRLRVAGLTECQSKVPTDTWTITATSAAMGMSETTGPRAMVGPGSRCGLTAHHGRAKLIAAAIVVPSVRGDALMDSLAVLSASALSEGVRFLFDQARLLLERRRSDRGVDGEAAEEPDGVVRLPSEAFTGTLDTRRRDEAALAESAPALRELRAALFPYLDDEESIQPGDAELLRLVDRLRQLLEAVYGQRITFASEAGERAGSGPELRASIDIKHITAEVTAIKARRISGGHIVVEMRADSAGESGRVVAVEAEDIGGPAGGAG
jgi:hypothetical protein